MIAVPQPGLRLVELTNHLTLISVLGRISVVKKEILLALDGDALTSPSQGFYITKVIYNARLFALTWYPGLGARR